MKLPPVVVYTVLRLLAFLVPFGILMLFPIMREYYWLTAIFAALIGFSLSLLFLRRPLADVSASVAARRAARKDRQQDTRPDEDVEDQAADAARSPEASGDR
ncbi:MAG TPA: DUF4229 domain-containing protein [Microbacterium sp.]|uniref:DUF4229 domain-containing protein n=1 Tax=Microbacterium sp. TaxID=51671 RepID=UPI002CA8846F|nr:DUF4229 domain-containing protein [Microbacterium sp.]HWI31510.1 DUF4229 domain-containing protein [Microbacterium sp.]